MRRSNNQSKGAMRQPTRFWQNFVSQTRKQKRRSRSATETRAAVNPRAEVTRTARGLRSATRREHARAFVSLRDEPSSKVASSSRRAEAAEEEAMRARVSSVPFRSRLRSDRRRAPKKTLFRFPRSRRRCAPTLRRSRRRRTPLFHGSARRWHDTRPCESK